MRKRIIFPENKVYNVNLHVLYFKKLRFYIYLKSMNDINKKEYS